MRWIIIKIQTPTLGRELGASQPWIFQVEVSAGPEFGKQSQYDPISVRKVLNDVRKHEGIEPIGNLPELEPGHVHFVEGRHGLKISFRIVTGLVLIDSVVLAVREPMFDLGRRLISSTNIQEAKRAITKSLD